MVVPDTAAVVILRGSSSKANRLRFLEQLCYDLQPRGTNSGKAKGSSHLQGRTLHEKLVLNCFDGRVEFG